MRYVPRRDVDVVPQPRTLARNKVAYLGTGDKLNWKKCLLLSVYRAYRYRVRSSVPIPNSQFQPLATSYNLQPRTYKALEVQAIAHRLKPKKATK